MSKCSSNSSWIVNFWLHASHSDVVIKFRLMNNITRSNTHVIIYSAVFFILFSNIAFISNVVAIYPVAIKNSLFLISLALVSASVISLMLSLICFKYTIKPVLIVIFIASSTASYFMDNYNLIIDEAMIESIFKTDRDEIIDLLSIKMLIYFGLLAVLPSILLLKVDIPYGSFRNQLFANLKIFSLSFVVIIITVLSLGDYYATFFREHALLRSYSNPTIFIYSSIKYLSQSVRGAFNNTSEVINIIGQNAELNYQNNKPKLIIFVVGETARADRFYLNGYSRDTNSLLKNENVISFTNFWSCATSTAISVPCMFSVYTEDQYQTQKVHNTENVLDVLHHAGVEVLWLDNNSDSKGVANRIPYQSFKSPTVNPICDIECRDEGMLVNLQQYIDDNLYQNIFIVLHQKGNHGPAYYKRYPENFERFKPSCKTNQLESCSDSEISNAYDNAIAYTDYFLSQVIKLLKNNANSFQSSMFYVSDHGESLGESGVYLHGMPNIFAPDVQRHIPAILWSNEAMHPNNQVLGNVTNDIKLSHDNIFHTILGLMEVNTSVYVEKLDILSILKMNQ